MTVLKKALFLTMLAAGLFKMTGFAQTSSAVPANQLVLAEKSHKIDFTWQGNALPGGWEPHAALLLPVKLPHSSRQFYMQFDLGVPTSFFYSNKLKAIAMQYQGAMQWDDSISSLKDFTFKVGNVPVKAKEIPVKPFGNATVKNTDKKDQEIIGTIGADFIESKVVLIDYPAKRILIGIDLTQKQVWNEKMAPFIYTGRRILLPTVIKGKQTLLFFDTGSSAYELITDQKTVTTLAIPHAKPLQYDVKSWDRTWTVHTSPTRDSLEIAFQQIPINKVAYIEGPSSAQIDQMMKLGIGGMAGNKLFIHYQLLLDMRNQKFGIRQPGR